MGLNPTHDILRRHGTRLSCYLAPASEKSQSGNAADTVLGSQRRLSLGVHLGQARVRLQHARCLDEGRRHHLAGPAPGRPEIHQYRDLIAVEVSGESSGREFHRLAGEQRLVALSTIGLLVESCSRHTVDRVTAGANKVQGVAHENFSV